MKKTYIHIALLFFVPVVTLPLLINAQSFVIPPMRSAEINNSFSVNVFQQAMPLLPEVTSQPLPLVEFQDYATVTSYSSLDSCHYAGCVMANGKPAQVGYVACPRKLDLGTIVFIDGDEYVCGDRTAKRFDGRYDIFQGYGVGAHEKAIKFGIKKLQVHVKK